MIQNQLRGQVFLETLQAVDFSRTSPLRRNKNHLLASDYLSHPLFRKFLPRCLLNPRRSQRLLLSLSSTTTSSHLHWKRFAPSHPLILKAATAVKLDRKKSTPKLSRLQSKRQTHLFQLAPPDRATHSCQPTKQSQQQQEVPHQQHKGTILS